MLYAVMAEEAMRNVKLIIEYDGTDYKGWQVQPGSATIQGVLEEKLKVITGETAHVIGSGRTDAGVHAFGQVAHVRIRSRMDLSSIQRALNSLLPSDIV